MKFSATSGSVNKQNVDCLVVPVFGTKLSDPATALDKLTHKAISRVLAHGDLVGRFGDTLLLHDCPGITAKKVLLVDCGLDKTLSKMNFRTVCSKVASTLATAHMTAVSIFLQDITVTDADLRFKLIQLTLALGSALYQFDKHKSKKLPKRHLQNIQFFCDSAKDKTLSSKAIKEASAMVSGMETAKNLANMAANYCTPAYFAKKAHALTRTHPTLRCKVIGEAEMKKLGMDLLLSVSQGSPLQAKLIFLHYDGGRKGEKPIIIMGKGVTFDTGGISIKPREGMDEMKFDMCGAASVLGAMQACAELGLKKNVIGVMVAVENQIGSKATKPGDIFKSMSGLTVEILNTDAEGRLILADALHYVKRFKPACVVDVATLTGLMVMTLADKASGLFTRDKQLHDTLISAGEATYDRVWPMPMYEEYISELNSNFADCANIGPRVAGSITAACFLEKFATDLKWAHIDCAGVAWHSGASKGATGRPVPLLVEFLLQQGV